ncbi:MAG: hypothetical protein OEZ23_01690 [Gammaproteobacteria bacterium]|nr:hypothetical protein [Gammaproteobacteria bacterium]
MSEWLVLLIAFVHDLSVAVYVGGAVAMEFILAPAQSAIPPAQAQIMGEKTSDRFLLLVWISLILIFITGVLRLYAKGFIGGETFFHPLLGWDYSYGRSLIMLFGIWVILVINGLLITFLFRPVLQGKLSTTTDQTQATRNRNAKMQAAEWIQNLSRADLVLAILATLLGASLLRGGLM